jgi:hypothetical protein
MYLSFVPLSSTGFYTILVDPLESTEARETSLKLLDSALLKYSFSFLKSALAPLLSVLTIIVSIQSLRSRKFLKGFLSLLIFFFSLVAVMLPGARLPGALLILTVIFALFLLYKMHIRPLYILIGFLLVIMLPLLMTIFREGQSLGLFIIFDYMKGGIFHRTFVVPMETGLWHVHYAQASGFVGFSAIPKLAQLMNVDPINLPNIIYLKYSPYHLYSGFSNTCFVFAYYTSFGLGSLVLSLLGLWVLDLSLLVYDKLKNLEILVAAIASITTSSFAFVSTMYTTVLITNGFLIILIIAHLLDRFLEFGVIKPRRERRNET